MSQLPGKTVIINSPAYLPGQKGQYPMKEADRNALIAIPLVILIGVGVAFAGSQGGAIAFGVPLFALVVGLAFLIQWLAFISAFMNQTEKFYDLTGGFTYISVTIIALLFSPVRDGRSILLLVLVVVWAARLSIFLFRRVHKVGKDVRFDEMKPSFFRFLNAWNIQGLWVVFTLSAGLVAITTSVRKDLDIFAVVGTLIWIFGFAFEVIADNQKSKFRANTENNGKFIQSGLWSKSRHPNYFGEIVLWIGIAVIALPVLRGWQWLALISPLFITFLVTRVSGVPMLEKSADERWGCQEEYENYKKRTPVLIPRL